jgi:4-amino-4-deoxy-L-arabinose transferase-like glycosyltransferase
MHFMTQPTVMTGIARVMRHQTAWMVAVVGLAVLLRLLFAGFVVGLDRAPFGDETDYHAMATNLSEGRGLALESGNASARRPPLYPLLLAAVYRVTGPEPAVARVLQAFTGGAVVWLTFLVAAACFNRRVAWWALVAATLNPFLIFTSGYLLTENLYTALLLCFLLVVHDVDAIASWRRAAAAGALLALASLARPTGLVFAEWVALVFLLFSRVPLKLRAARVGVAVVAFALVLTPWVVRNYRAFDHFIPFTTHGGMTFYQGNNIRVLEVPQYRGGVAPVDQIPGAESLKSLTQLEREEAGWTLGKQFLKENKRQIPRLLWNKFARFWRFRTDVGLSGIKSGWWFGKDTIAGRLAANLDVGFAYAIVAIPLMWLGLVASWRRWRQLLFLHGMILAHTAVSLVFHGSLRMRSPIEPVIAILAAFGLVWAADAVRSRRGNAPEGASGN